MIEHFNSNQALYTFLATLLTALATVVLVWATFVLARITGQMHTAATAPNLILTITPSRWSSIHLNQRILNAGAGPAFDVEAKVTVKKPDGNEGSLPQKVWERFAVLAPGQELNSHMGSAPELLGATFLVTLSWSLSPKARKRERRTYEIETASWKDTALEAGGDPMVKVAEHLKKLRDDWQAIATGSRRLNSNVFDSSDRATEQEGLRAQYQDFNERQKHSNE